MPPVFGLVADHAGSYSPSWLALAGYAVVGTALGLAIRDRAHGAAGAPRVSPAPAPADRRRSAQG